MNFKCGQMINPRTSPPPPLVQTEVHTPAALQTEPFPSNPAPWGRASCTCRCVAPLTSSPTHSRGLSKPTALPSLGLDNTGHPWDCHPEAWPTRGSAHHGETPRFSQQASSRSGLPSLSVASLIPLLEHSVESVFG